MYDKEIFQTVNMSEREKKKERNRFYTDITVSTLRSIRIRT